MSDPRIASADSSFIPSIADSQQIEKPKAGGVCSIEQNQVEKAERRYALSTMSPLESTISRAISRLLPGQSFEVNCKALVSAELASTIEGSISIERRRDGRYQVETSAGGQIGAGASLARAMVGVAGGTTFVVETPEAAADLAQAIATLGVVALLRSTLFPWAPLADAVTRTSAHAIERLDRYRSNLTRVKVEARASAGFSKSLHSPELQAHANAEIQSSAVVKVDFEREVISAAFRVAWSGELKAGLGHRLAATSSSVLSDGELEGKMQARLEARKHLPPAMTQQLKRGNLSPSDAFEGLKDAKTEWVIVVEVETETTLKVPPGNGISRARFVTEIPVHGETMAKKILAGESPAALLKPNAEVGWNVEVEIGIGLRTFVATDGLLAGASGLVFTKGKAAKGSLPACVEHARNETRDALKMQQWLEAQRRQ
jgi:hypothetical protein